MDKEKGKVEFYIGFLTINFYYPRFYWYKASYGISFNTDIIGRRLEEYQKWWIYRSLVIRVLGFGIGFAWKHIDNPNWEKEQDKNR